MDYDLDRLGTREFEHLVQALAIAELGNGVQVFGDGADGGREVTFNGAVNFPHGLGQATWTGYGIVQAKHRLHPGEPDNNATWLIGQLRDELSKFKPDSNGNVKRKRRPDYYLIASNVRLSPAPAVGGVDRVDAELGTQSRDLSLKGYAVWHYDQICRLLEIHQDVRQAFGGFLTVGDVLASMQEFFDGPTVSIASQLRVHAAQQLRAKQWVRLGDSGLDDDDKLPLSEVGVDLPAIALGEADGAPQLEVRAIQRVLDRGNESLREPYRNGSPLGVVIIGGPGQGKSTLAQIVCQAYRAALIDETAGPSLGVGVDQVLAGTRDSLTRMGIRLPTNKRWPVYVELSKFGDAMAANPQASLLGYIAADITSNGSQLLTNQLARWLRSWPWVLVLDGLDEVAALQTRERVIEAISDFVIESAQNKDDVLIVATTRPQGYHGEFGEFEPEQLELRPLSISEGLEYGNQVVRTRHSQDPELSKEVSERLGEAARNIHTSRLMRSPLQVTIMATLLERFKRAPSTRHALFDAYYSTIYSREVSKAGNLGHLLDLYADDVHFVHEQVALYLQVRAELDGESDALLPDADLKKLFVDRLTRAGHPPSDVERLSGELMGAAKNRIVLLVAGRSDYIGFEVRSLQEYMAARALASGTDGDVLARLDVIASSAHWRNTWLLTAGRLFAQKEHLRDGLLERMKQLDTETFEGLFIGYGERLALDLLEDDLALAVPRSRKSLLAHALQALHRWPGPDTRRLADISHAAITSADKEANELVRRALTEAFESKGRARISAVAILRTWEKRPGSGGALAKLLLGKSKDWRPDINEDSRKQQATVSAAKVVEPHFADKTLTEDQRAARQDVLDLLKKQKVLIGRSPAEAGSYARQRIYLPDALEFQQLLSDPEVMQGLMQAVEQLSVNEAVPAIWIQQLIIVLDERRAVGNDSRISVPGSGLF